MCRIRGLGGFFRHQRRREKPSQKRTSWIHLDGIAGFWADEDIAGLDREKRTLGGPSWTSAWDFVGASWDFIVLR